MSDSVKALGLALVGALAEVVGARLEAMASSAEGQVPRGSQWCLTIEPVDAGDSSFVLALEAEAVAGLARALGLGDDEVAVGSLLRDLVNEAGAGLATRHGDGVPSLMTRNATLVDGPPSGLLEASASVAVVGLSAAIQVGWYAATQVSRTAQSGLGRPGVREAGPSRNDAPERALRNDLQQARLDAILEIDLPVVVRFGRTEMPLRAVTRLAPGAVIELGRSPDDPVELLVSDRVVARGEVVVVGGNYGIRIIDVVSPSERVRSLEG